MTGQILTAHSSDKDAANCGCTLHHTDEAHIIVWCPFHAAAPELMGRLQDLVKRAESELTVAAQAACPELITAPAAGLRPAGLHGSAVGVGRPGH